uniref:protein ILRUN n=2 Tax=Myxine glutinosa TaxID=7769 RepID=UPI0035900666
MDVDMDIDQELMQKFSCMGTTDKDVLISEFQKLLGFQLNPAGCAFFLDMANWNLQAAIGAYYDFETPNIVAPCMSFVKDVTIGEGESVPPNTHFTKTWRIQNTGTEDWPVGVVLKFVNGHQFGHVGTVPVRPLEPQQMTDVSVEMLSPGPPSIYQGQWRMCTANGLYFGDVIWVIISVEIGGLLGVTQQLSSLGCEPASLSPTPKTDYNPFGSPQKMEEPVENGAPFHVGSPERIFHTENLPAHTAFFGPRPWEQESKNGQTIECDELIASEPSLIVPKVQTENPSLSPPLSLPGSVQCNLTNSDPDGIEQCLD